MASLLFTCRGFTLARGDFATCRLITNFRRTFNVQPLALHEPSDTHGKLYPEVAGSHPSKDCASTITVVCWLQNDEEKKQPFHRAVLQ